MDHAFSVLMFVFAGLLLAYAALMACTKNAGMLPRRAAASVKPKNPEKYMTQLAKAVALTALAVGAGAAVALWIEAAGAAVMLTGVAAALWFSTRLIRKAS